MPPCCLSRCCPLLTSLIVVAGRGGRPPRVKIAVWPIGAAFVGAVVTLYVVATKGPFPLRFYDPTLAGSFPCRSASTSTVSARS